MKIAIIGSGISGLTCAHLLHRQHQVTVFEASAWVGGHTHRDMVQTPDGILCLTTASDSFNDIGNTDEQCFDIFTVNRKTHRIDITRIGRGDSRSFGYEVF